MKPCTLHQLCMLGILLDRFFLIARSNFVPLKYFRQKNNFLKEKTLARASCCCGIFYLDPSGDFWRVRESWHCICLRTAQKTPYPDAHLHTHTWSYVENFKVWSSPPPSHDKMNLNGMSLQRLTFPRLSYFAYPTGIILLVARGSANQEGWGSWHAMV